MWTLSLLKLEVQNWGMEQTQKTFLPKVSWRGCSLCSHSSVGNKIVETGDWEPQFVLEARYHWTSVIHKKKWEKVIVYRQFLEYLAIVLASICSSNVLIWLHIAFSVIKVTVYQKCYCLHFQTKCKTWRDFTLSAVICYSTNYAYNFKIR